jgi:hypothetical protein
MKVMDDPQLSRFARTYADALISLDRLWRQCSVDEGADNALAQDLEAMWWTMNRLMQGVEREFGPAAADMIIRRFCNTYCSSQTSCPFGKTCPSVRSARDR